MVGRRRKRGVKKGFASQIPDGLGRLGRRNPFPDVRRPYDRPDIPQADGGKRHWECAHARAWANQSGVCTQTRRGAVPSVEENNHVQQQERFHPY